VLKGMHSRSVTHWAWQQNGNAPPERPARVRCDLGRRALRSWQLLAGSATSYHRLVTEALPISRAGAREPRIDRAADTIRIVGVWWEDGFAAANPGTKRSSAFGTLPRTARLRPIAGEIRERLALAGR
jgi:hypothetical protein